MTKSPLFPVRSLLACVGCALLLALGSGCAGTRNPGPHPTFIINNVPPGNASLRAASAPATLTLNLPPLHQLQTRRGGVGKKALYVRNGEDDERKPVIVININRADLPMPNNPGPHPIIVQTTAKGDAPVVDPVDQPDALVIRFKGGYPGTAAQPVTLSEQDLLNEPEPPK